MNEPKRCETCRHWTRNTPMGEWGECCWAGSLALPWWKRLDDRGIPTTETEGDECQAWDAKP